MQHPPPPPTAHITHCCTGVHQSRVNRCIIGIPDPRATPLPPLGIGVLVHAPPPPPPNAKVPSGPPPSWNSSGLTSRSSRVPNGTARGEGEGVERDVVEFDAGVRDGSLPRLS